MRNFRDIYIYIYKCICLYVCIYVYIYKYIYFFWYVLHTLFWRPPEAALPKCVAALRRFGTRRGAGVPSASRGMRGGVGSIFFKERGKKEKIVGQSASRVYAIFLCNCVAVFVGALLRARAHTHTPGRTRTEQAKMPEGKNFCCKKWQIRSTYISPR